MNQVHYHSLSSSHVINQQQHPHTLPSHFPQPQFYHQPQFYQQPSYYYQPQHHSQRYDQFHYPPPPNFTLHNFTLHNNNTVPLHTYPSNNNNNVLLPTTPKPLPTVSHIPILSGWSDFNAWNNGVRSLILYLGYTGHIASQPAPGVVPDSDGVPSYPPNLSTPPSMAEITALCAWWEEDNIVSHILMTRLASAVFSILPYADDDGSLAR